MIFGVGGAYQRPGQIAKAGVGYEQPQQQAVPLIETIRSGAGLKMVVVP